jgi:hypothetical protein
MIAVVALVAACGTDGTSLGNTTAATPTTTSGTTPIALETTPTAMNGATPTAAPAGTPATTSTTPTAPVSGSIPVTSRPGPTTPTMPANTTGPIPTAAPAPATTGKTVTIWIQATDSCMEAIPGAQFIVNGPGVANRITGMTPGTLPVGVPGYVSGQCPINRGSCVNSLTGCVTAVLDVPTSGTATYMITPKTVSVVGYLSGIAMLVPKQYLGQGGYSRNYSYVQCEGGSDCPHGPETATVHISSNGSVSATTQNVNPDGFVDAPWPSTGTFTGAKSDPVMFHLFGASAPTDFSMVCNQAIKAGDTVSKDPLEMHMTGNPNWPHCRSGR